MTCRTPWPAAPTGPADLSVLYVRDVTRPQVLRRRAVATADDKLVRTDEVSQGNCFEAGECLTLHRLTAYGAPMFEWEAGCVDHVREGN